MDQENWTSCSGKQRSRSCRPANGLQEKGRFLSLDLRFFLFFLHIHSLSLHLFENSMKEDQQEEGLLVRHLLSKGQGEMNTMTTTRQSFPTAKGAEVSASFL